MLYLSENAPVGTFMKEHHQAGRFSVFQPVKSLVLKEFGCRPGIRTPIC